MTRKVYYFLTLLMLLAFGTGTSFADFKNFAVQVNNQTGTLLTTAEQVQNTAFSFGVAVADDGTVSRVAADDASSVATVSGKYHSDHGATGLSVVVPVSGNVKITVAQCTYSTGAITVKNSAGDVVVTKTPATPACWKNANTNVDELYYTGDATTLTISGMSYCAYVAVETSTAVINKYDITYSLGSETAEGVAPAAVTYTEGDAYTIPANRTLYKDGYTLTGWNDGEKTYAAGEAYTPTKDVTLTPVFTANAKSLADRTDAVTLKWDFQRKNGAPTLAYQGATGIYVTQADVDGTTIDVKLDFDATSGKIANANWTDWCQMNSGTKLTIPSCKGAQVTIEAYSAPTTTTIDGLTDYTASGNVISMEIGSKADYIDIVIGDGSYYRYFQTVLPYVEPEKAAVTYTNEAASVVWACNSSTEYDAATATPKDGFSTVAMDTGDLSIDGTGSSTVSSGVTFVMFKPTGSTKAVDCTVKPAAGLTFTPSAISMYICRFGTDAENSVSVTAMLEDGTSEVLGTYTAPRNNKDKASDKFGTSSSYVENGYVTITLTDEQKKKFATTGSFTISTTVGGNSAKDYGLSGIHIDGTLDGTIADVNKYTVSIASNIDEAGSVSIYPKSDEYVENDDITLTAAENFGYDFVNWTNAAGEVASTEAKFKTSVTANETYTANFQKVNTYELAVVLEGGANDYQISYDPAPTVVNNKNMYEEGTKVSVSAASNRVVTFNNWSNGETSASIDVTMDADKSITATYSAIDFIAGWDFYAAGGTSRTPDFYGNADNAADNFGLINAEGTAKGFYLRPYNNSYEGKTCALNWNMIADKWYYQTKINASEYKNITIESLMMYNYNAYSVQKLEASLDGTTWETITSQDLGGTKNWQEVNGTLPSTYDNQAEVYLRWIPDYTSEVKGTSSTNDGTSITNIFIIGDKQVVDDGIAPALVSSVPADKATNASANGKIVLTFSKKVQLTDAAKATLGDTELTPAVSGKTITFQYKGLSYSTDYTFTLAANSVADLTGNNILKDAVTINFQTKVKPTVEKGLYDVIVSTSDELDAAIAAANSRADQTTRYRIFIKNGNYTLAGSGEDKTVTVTLADKVTTKQYTYKNPTTYLSASNVSFIGESIDGVVITNKAGELDTYEGQYGTACVAEGIGNGDVIYNTGTLNYFQNLTFKSSMGDGRGRDIVLQEKGNKTVFKDACLWGYQDTYTSNNQSGKFYFEGGVLRGRTDYLCGKGDVYYNGVTLQQCGTGGYLAVPSQAKKYGYVFESCYIKKETSDVTFYLGRPWGSGTPIACFLNTTMDTAPLGDGWADMSGGYPARFAEYNSMLTNGAVLDLSGRRTSWTDNSNVTHANNPIITADEAASMSLSAVMGQDDDWDPTALTEQAPVAENVVIVSNTISWDNSDYAYCWAVCKDGKVVDFTKEPTYTVDDASAAWSVRAANEMGGLGEAVAATASTGIISVAAQQSAANNFYNIAGQRVNASAKGIIISNGKKMIVK